MTNKNTIYFRMMLQKEFFSVINTKSILDVCTSTAGKLKLFTYIEI